jgi:hypothetical protein
MPPVSVTMQARKLLVAGAVVADEADEAGALDELVEAGLLLLPHPATASVADTASASVAHVLCFTLTSTGPGTNQHLASHSSWVVPQAMPG